MPRPHEPLAVPASRMTVFHDYVPYAEIDIRFTDTGRRGVQRRRAAESLAAAYGVRTRPFLCTRDSLSANGRTFNVYHGVDPHQLTASGDPEAVARFTAALPAALHALEAAATHATRAFGRWLRTTAAGEEAAAGAGSAATLQRNWRSDVLQALASAVTPDAGSQLPPFDPGADWTTQTGRYAHSAAAELRAHVPEWDDDQGRTQLWTASAHQHPDGPPVALDPAQRLAPITATDPPTAVEPPRRIRLELEPVKLTRNAK